MRRSWWLTGKHLHLVKRPKLLVFYTSDSYRRGVANLDNCGEVGGFRDEDPFEDN